MQKIYESYIFKNIIVITLFTINMTNAQNNSDIVGIYNLGSSSPEGSNHLFVLDDNNYAITYFGGIQTGKWAVMEENEYLFTPQTKETKFELFGRINKELGDSTKIAFNGFENGETFIQLRNNIKDEYNMQQVFNAGANCFSYPYVHTFNTKANYISFLSVGYGEINNPILTFKNSNKYNDFVAVCNEEDGINPQPFLVTFKDEKLHFKNGDSSKHSPLDENDEDIAFIKNFIKNQTNKNTLYFNPWYNMLGESESDLDIEETLKYYTYNPKKNALIDIEYYIEGEEYIETEDSYDRMTILYSYEALIDHTIDTVKYKTDKNSLFNVTCD